MFKNIIIRGKQVPLFKHESVSVDILSKIESCKKFNNYILNLQPEIDVKSITVLSVYMFGNNVGFVNLDVDAYLNQKKIPGYVFLRGDAVAILLLVNDQMLLTKQFRVPVGRFTIEAPAGMVDESDNFAGVAAKEIQEECGLTIQHHEMKYLQDVLISPGGSDEVIHLFSVEKQVPAEELEGILNKIHGAEHEGEQIQLLLKEFTVANVLETQDVKLISAATAYLHRKQQPAL